MPTKETIINERRNGDHDLLIEIKVKLESLYDIVKSQGAELTTLKSDTIKRVDVLEQLGGVGVQEHDQFRRQLADHERRIRFIERYVWGAIALVGAIELLARFIK